MGTSQSAIERGVAHAQAGRFAEAIEDFERAAATQPGLLAFGNLGSAQHELGKARHAAGDPAWRAAIAASRAALDAALRWADPPDPWVALQGANLMLLGEDAAARALLLERLPTVVDPTVRAELVDRLGRLATRPPPDDTALGLYERDFAWASAVLKPLAFPSGGPRRVFDAATRAQIDAAVAVLGRAVALYPRSWPAWWFLGHGHTLAGDLPAARAAFAEAWALHPAHPDVARELVLAHLRLGDAAGAAASDRIVTLHPGDATLRANHALVLLMRGETAAAQAEIAVASALGPGDPVTAALAARIEAVAAGRAAAPTRIG